ncbi:cytochrome c3 family protein [Desulfosporosinus sp. OT]|uniref:cytochrome c3 family protein n=1 Tax=Desulfosporosinus sp. OT TaxID=913865 RepID=UPI000223AF44|nr:cytochrome c3 family protein [Desulfosporosinus sp. OT]EGW38228.1 doubled CXXCH motif family protein [Desulfosporosinus sp. OT]
MGIFSKLCLGILFFAVFICLSSSWSNQVVRADVLQGINNVSVDIAAPENQPLNTSRISLAWPAVSPVNGGVISYDIEKSTDGGLTFVLLANITAANWTDNNVGQGVPNYTNIIYRLRSKETVGETTTISAYSRPVNVFPPDINVHDNYMSNTNLCKTCHITHNGKTEQLLNVPTASALCLTCHEGLTNSKYDVVNGYTKTADGVARSLGGSFGHNGIDGDVWAGGSTTSTHNVDETTAVSAPGGMNASQPMGCTTCHSGHATGNYRMLRNTISVPSAPNILTPVNVSVVAGAKANDPSSGETPVYISGIESLCQSCHSDYTAAAGAGGSGPAAPTASQYSTPGVYRHPVNIAPADKSLTTTLPLEGTARDNTDKMTCLTCHYSHGSTVKDANVSTVVTGDGTSLQTTVSTDLKRMDGMKVCEDCHKK